MRSNVIVSWVIIILFIFLSSCSNEIKPVKYDFDTVNDRCWISEDFWTVPLEDWRIGNGRIEFTGKGQQATCTILPYMLEQPDGSFNIKLQMGLIERGEINGSAGLTIGSVAAEENDHRAAIFFGKGINVGINTENYAFIGQNTKKLPSDFNYGNFFLEITGQKESEGYTLILKVLDSDETPVAEVKIRPENPVTGIVQLVNNFRTSRSQNNAPCFWFDNLEISGTAFSYKPENRYGPVLWTMYTLSRGVMKMTAQMPPVGDNDNHTIELQFKNDGKWTTSGKQQMDLDSRTVTFRIEGWDSSSEKEYRIMYNGRDIFGKETEYEYTGKIRKEPLDRPLKMAVMTCQHNSGFPYSPVFDNLKKKDPDIMYFSGDQIYEQNGGYPIKREPEDTAIINYLGKWYMFGWAFGDLMRDRPTVCTPDDHDVFQGNLWGGGGIPKPAGLANTDDYTGFTQTVKWVNVVNTTQCAHLPDPWDPSPIEQGMKVWYTAMNYGRISFAIVSDRIFKSGPDLVSTWEGRKDHVKEPLRDPSVLERPGLQFLGERQEEFLENWIRDWKNVDIKVLLSQTLFTNVATHHGQFDGFLLGDMDSGGWPKKGRDKALEIMRKAFVFHLSGDQHIPSLVQYGINDYRDAGWSFVPPAIAVGYSRWFRPDELNYPVNNRPAHGLPNTGEYRDAFGNPNYVYAIGNPGEFGGIQNRYEMQNKKAGGLGFVIFDRETRDITIEAWHFLSDVSAPDADSQFPGWPLIINQMDNYGRKETGWLPTLKIKGDPDPVVEITDQSTGELEYIIRINGNEFIPKVFSNNKYNVRIGYPEKDLYIELKDMEPEVTSGKTAIEVNFE